MAKAKRVHSTPRRTASKTKPKSAITRVLKSGYDLVPTTPRGDRGDPEGYRSHGRGGLRAYIGICGRGL
jgi:hypothetical protein